jgi:glycosyltransferase involved in cell wall biosynthesis
VARALFWFALGRPVRDALKGVDVVHYSGAGREMLGFVARRAAADLGVPFVVTPHTHEGVWGDSPLDGDLYGRADRVIAVTKDEARRLSGLGVDPGRIGVVGHGVSVGGGGDAARFRTRHGLTGPIVLFVGRRTPDKGYDLLLEAAPAIWAREPRAHIVLAGTPGQARELPRALADSRVRDLGPLDDQEREDAYAACDVFVLPSQAEAFGLVVQEAWAYARPVVVSDIPTLRERVADAGGGLLSRRDPDAFADAICRLLGDERLRRQMGAAGAAVAAANSWSDAARRTAAIYADAADSYARRPRRDD